MLEARVSARAGCGKSARPVRRGERGTLVLPLLLYRLLLSNSGGFLAGNRTRSTTSPSSHFRPITIILVINRPRGHIIATARCAEALARRTELLRFGVV